MDIPDFVRFAPVPVRDRHNGWTARRQRLFILRLACGDGPAEAARVVGCSRQSVYALRRRDDARAFAIAWDEAQAFARQARQAGRRLPSRDSDLDVVFVPRFYRGKLVGYVEREDLKSAMRTLSRLDRLSRVVSDSGGFDFDVLVEQAAASVEIDKSDNISL
jgi:hypothetical protein